MKRYVHKLSINLHPEKVYILMLAEKVPHIHFHLIPRYSADQVDLQSLFVENRSELQGAEILIQEINRN